MFGVGNQYCCTSELSKRRNDFGANPFTVCTGGVAKVCLLNPGKKQPNASSSTCSDPVASVKNCNGWFGDLDETTHALGTLDTLFFSFYAIGLFCSGYVMDRLNLRLALFAGMTVSALVTACFGLFGMMKSHSFWLYAVLWSINGLIQSSGWPGTVAFMGLWFGDFNPCGNIVFQRGAVIGTWAANASMGNIIGASVVTFVLSSFKLPGMYAEGYNGNWQMCMIAAAACLLFVAILVLLFLHTPRDMGYRDSMDIENQKLAAESIFSADELDVKFPSKYGTSKVSDREALLLSADDNEEIIPLQSEADSNRLEEEVEGIGFLEALLIPGVLPYAICYLGLKLANYAMFFWLPFYLSHSIFIGKSGASEKSNSLSELYDVGQIIGGAVGGYVSDRVGMRSPVVVFMLLPATITFFFFIGGPDLAMLTFLIPVSGFLLGGPANLLSGAISADLGTHPSLEGNSRALGTVSGIIDGTGSVGAAIGQYLIIDMANCGGSCAKYSSKEKCCGKHPAPSCAWKDATCNSTTDECNWTPVFVLLISCVFLSCFILSKMVYVDICGRKAKEQNTEIQKSGGNYDKVRE